MLMFIIASLLPLATAAHWDPNNLASDKLMKDYKVKGKWLGCIVDANEKSAGKMFNPSNRNPPTAASPFTGTLDVNGL